MSIGPHIPGIQLFQNLMLKIQGQGHGWGQSWVTTWVQHSVNSHPFRSMSIGPPIPEIQYFQNLTLKIQSQGQMTMMLHNYRSRQFHRSLNGINPSSGSRSWVRSDFKSQCGSNILSTHIPFVPCLASHSWVTTFSKFIPYVNPPSHSWDQSHNVGLTSYQLTSFWFHVNRPTHSWDTTFSKFDLENPGSRSNDHDVAQLQV